MEEDDLKNSTVVLPEEKEDTDSKSGDVLNFLKNIKLDFYYDSFVENGADKMNQLIYVDDCIIDQLCAAANMKVIHCGVLKKAIRECRASAMSARLQCYAKNGANGGSPEREKFATSRYENSNPANLNQIHNHPHFHHGEYPPSFYESRRRNPYTETGYYSNSQPQSSHYLAISQSHGDQYQMYGRYPISYPNDTQPSNPRYTLQNEDASAPTMVPSATRIENERKPLYASEHQGSGSKTFSDGYTQQFLTDGSYFVSIAERSVKFPTCVRLLTHLDRIDSERKEIIRKGSQIFGRDDTKRKTAELAPLEILMNEIAFEVCLRDFTYMISRQKLLGLVREIVKDNQIQLSAHHSSFLPSGITSVSLNRENNRQSISKVKPNTFFENNVETITVDPEDAKISSDYDVILYHKMHREWLPGISKERRKYLGRRSSNFEAINGILFYSKENKRRQWLFEEDDIKNCFIRHHIDPNTGEHFTKELTLERMSAQYYCKNMNETITRLYLSCENCHQRFYNVPGPITYSSTNNIRSVNSMSLERDQSNASYPTQSLEDPSSEQTQNNDSNETSLNSSKRKVSNTKNISSSPPVKKARKSTPHKFVPSEKQIEDISAIEPNEKQTENGAENDIGPNSNDQVDVSNASPLSEQNDFNQENLIEDKQTENSIIA